MQKITSWILADKNAGEIAKFYASVFQNSKLGEVRTYPDNGMPDDVLTSSIEILGREIFFLNGGPNVKPNPSISFFVNSKDEAELDEWWKKLSEGGKALMEYQKYPFSEKYGWLEDKYGISWQLSLTKEDSQLAPLLMFTHKNFGKAEEAINFYTKLFSDYGIADSKVGTISRYEEGSGDDTGKINYAEFTLAGENFKAMENSFDHKFDFNDAISIYVDCEDQKEVDHFWNNLIADGGEESQCGWLKDKYGVSWQIIPKQLDQLMNDPDKEKAGRVMQAMLEMRKIDVAKLQEAYDGK